jgi:large subunit ribosomal protein L17
VRHQRAGKKLGRDSAHRKALYSNLAGALIEHGRIKTTVTKAKAVKPLAEQMITLGRRGDLHARRQATAFLRSRDVVHHLFAEVAPRFKDRPGGYTRIVKLGTRPGDAAEMAYLELVDEEYVAELRAERQTAVADVPAEAEQAPGAEGEPSDEEPGEEELAAAEQEPEPAADAEEASAAAAEAGPAADAEATGAAVSGSAEPASDAPEAEDPPDPDTDADKQP